MRASRSTSWCNGWSRTPRSTAKVDRGIATAAACRCRCARRRGHQNSATEIARGPHHGPLVFLDVDEVRQRLKGHPWIADATVLKLYPGELQIGIKEREPFALWQKDGRVSVIAEDGTVLEPYVEPRLVRLPLVVGRGAQTKAKEFLA